jgi:hypothetical protein
MTNSASGGSEVEQQSQPVAPRAAGCSVQAVDALSRDHRSAPAADDATNVQHEDASHLDRIESRS